MEDFERYKTQGSVEKKVFVPVKNDLGQTEIGLAKEIDKPIEDKGIAGFVTGLVESFETKFPTAFFILVIVGYIIIESFGSHRINILQYSLVILASLVVYCFLKYPEDILGFCKKHYQKIVRYKNLLYIILVVMIVAMLSIYYVYGKPVVYFEKNQKKADPLCTTTEQFIKESK